MDDCPHVRANSEYSSDYGYQNGRAISGITEGLVASRVRAIQSPPVRPTRSPVASSNFRIAHHEHRPASATFPEPQEPISTRDAGVRPCSVSPYIQNRPQRPFSSPGQEARDILRPSSSRQTLVPKRFSTPVSPRPPSRGHYLNRTVSPALSFGLTASRPNMEDASKVRAVTQPTSSQKRESFDERRHRSFESLRRWAMAQRSRTTTPVLHSITPRQSMSPVRPPLQSPHTPIASPSPRSRRLLSHMRSTSRGSYLRDSEETQRMPSPVHPAPSLASSLNRFRQRSTSASLDTVQRHLPQPSVYLFPRSPSKTAKAGSASTIATDTHASATATPSKTKWRWWKLVLSDRRASEAEISHRESREQEIVASQKLLVADPDQSAHEVLHDKVSGQHALLDVSIREKGQAITRCEEVTIEEVKDLLDPASEDRVLPPASDEHPQGQAVASGADSDSLKVKISRTRLNLGGDSDSAPIVPSRPRVVVMIDEGAGEMIKVEVIQRRKRSDSQPNEA